MIDNEVLEDISDRLESIVDDLDRLKTIDSHLETIWQRLEGIEHYLQEIAEYGVLGREVEEAIIAIARSISKPLDAKYKEQLEQEAGKV